LANATNDSVSEPDRTDNLLKFFLLMRHSEERCAEQRARHCVNENQGKNFSGSSLAGFQMFQDAQDLIGAF